jgi:regulation of enolase protein 1 (concanavalin A-like superfamily)
MSRRNPILFGALAIVTLVSVGCGTQRLNEPTEEIASAVTADSLLALTNTCKVVSSHTYALDDGTKTNICSLNGAVFWKADMDIDCDGKTTTQCNSSTDCCYQNDTAFHNNAGEPLTASVTPYIVIPNDFHYTGLNGGNVAAVIYNGKIQYAVFGDTGPTDIIGEASYACAQKLGINPDPKNGGVGGGVTYIQFVGSGARGSDIENQTETATLGDKLANQLIANNGGGCTKTTCAAQGKNCGSISNGCGGTLSCGTCAAGQSCNSSHQCVTGSSWSSQDVGSVSPAGTDSQSSGTFTVKGAGADIWGAADGFRYVYQSLSGDGSITARVASIQNVNTWSKAGVMIRDGLTAGAKNVYMLTSPTATNNYRWQVRAAAGGSTTSAVPPSTACGNGTAPVWMRITRSGSTLTGLCSPNGSSWTQVGTTTISMSSTVQVGLAVTSHANGTLATGTFDNVAVSAGSTCTPESSSSFCSRLGKNCGSVTGTDNCGQSRTVSSCGTCTSPQTCGGGGTANVCGGGSTSTCSFSITQNVYDGPNWWGTISFKNNGPATSSNFALSFNVPSGVHCDFAATGWTFTQSGVTCTYKKAGTTLASGASLTMNYSTDSQSFSAATSVVVHDSVCAP